MEPFVAPVSSCELCCLPHQQGEGHVSAKLTDDLVINGVWFKSGWTVILPSGAASAHAHIMKEVKKHG